MLMNKFLQYKLNVVVVLLFRFVFLYQKIVLSVYHSEREKTEQACFDTSGAHINMKILFL